MSLRIRSRSLNGIGLALISAAICSDVRSQTAAPKSPPHVIGPHGLALFLHGQPREEKNRPDPFEQPVKTPDHVKVVLDLRADQTTVKAGQKIAWSLELVNHGKQAVTLVQPGDGSDSAWRTPLIQWRINPPGPRGEIGRCGNINSLRPGEVFNLKPGQRVKLNEWVGQPTLVWTGKFQVSFRYVNQPDLKWRGLAMHNATTMDQVRRSTPLDVNSNAVEITVEK